MRWKQLLVLEFGGPPLRVALNLFIAAAIGVLCGHLLFGVPLSEGLALGAMLPGLVAVIVAGMLRD